MLKIEHIGIAVKQLATAVPIFEKLLNCACYKTEHIETEQVNVPGIVGFGMACEICRLEMEEDARRTSKLRDQLETELLKLEQTYVNGSTKSRLPHVTNISFRHVEADGLLMGVNKNIALSSGSACTSASIEPSYVLKALGLGDDMAHSSLRFGLGRFTDEEQINYTVNMITETVIKLREMSPVWEMFKGGTDLSKVELPQF